jgi:hypothetical protein|tara:strand:- start:6717 stop:6923 length:207 start_codon:yes stop_codon:yes gene_type:complete
MTNETSESAPLTDEHLTILNTALSAADAVESLIERARIAGIDLGDLPEQLHTEVDRARNIKQAFFPGR